MPVTDPERIHIQLTIQGTIAALDATPQTTVNILHYRRTAFPADFNAANFINACQAKFEAELLAAVSEHWTLENYHARVLNDVTDAGSTETLSSPGLVAGQCLPAHNCQLITKQTALRGRSYRGRIFIPTVPESGCDGNTLTAGQLALLAALAAKLDDTITDGDLNVFVPFLFSPTLSTYLTAPTDIKGADITSLTAKDDVAVNRSRRARAA